MKDLIKLLSMLKLELLFGILIFVFYLKVTPLDMLIQDKVCKLKYNMSDEFCRGLSAVDESDANHHLKTAILSEVVTFKSYEYMIYYIPGTIWSLFLGSWCDRYVSAKKWIMIIGAVTTAVENLINAFNSFYFSNSIYWILASFVPYTLSGAMAISTCYTYIAATSPDKYKAIRIIIIEILLMITQPAATVLAGKLINRTPIGGFGQIHNYGILFSICSLLGFVAFLWCVFMIDEERDKVMFELKFDEKVAKNSGYDTETHPLRLLFDLNNVKQMITCFLKKRATHTRAQIILVCLALFNYMYIRYAPFTFLYQFTVKVYKWDAEKYSDISSYGLLLNSAVAMVLGPVLVKKFQLNDMLISIIGFIGVFNQMLIRGLMLSPLGYYLSMATSCTFTLSSVGFKSHLSKIVDQTEVGKVFTIIMVIDSIAPILASTITAKVFEATISRAPGVCFFILAALSIMTIVIAIIIYLIHLRNQYNLNVKSVELGDNEINKTKF